MDLIGGLRAAVDGADDDEHDDEIVEAPKRKKKKTKNKVYYESSSSYEAEDERSHRPSKSRLWAERKDLRIPVSGLPLHLNVMEHDRVAAASITDWVKKSWSVSAYVQNSVTFRGDAERNRFKAEYWASNIDLTVNEMGWKAEVTKTLWRWQSDGY